MKKYDAFKKDGNSMLINGEVAIEVCYVIVASCEEEAIELIDSEGENSNDYYLIESGTGKSKSIKNVSL